uniref:Uncharacterized protein n=1 Tax=Parascaris univalens TaxID=6257 RepID=A0A915A6I2_PARUN
HKLIKISHSNQRFLTKLACCSSLLAFVSNLTSILTNNWLYTAEVLKYYVFPNRSTNFDDPTNQPVYFKNATFGPWLFCWLDPVSEFHCSKVDYFSVEEPSDVTTSVERSVRRSFFFMVSGACLDLLGVVSITACCFRRYPYRSLMCSSLLHIFCGMANFACIIVYMSAVSKEVGNKQYPATEMDDPLFHYSYGYSFIMLKTSFLGTEIAALFSVLVYMAKRDERTYNRYHIRFLTASLNNDRLKRESFISDHYYEHTRFKCLERASRSTSIDGSEYSHKKHEFHLPKLVEESDDLNAMFTHPSLSSISPRVSSSVGSRMNSSFSRPPLYRDNRTTYSSS